MKTLPQCVSCYIGFLTMTQHNQGECPALGLALFATVMCGLPKGVDCDMVDILSQGFSARELLALALIRPTSVPHPGRSGPAPFQSRLEGAEGSVLLLGTPQTCHGIWTCQEVSMAIRILARKTPGLPQHP